LNLYWNNSDSDIGDYELYLTSDDGDIVSKMYLRDYTCDFFKETGKPRRYENVSFEYSYCNGFSIHKCIEENVTLEQAKKQAEDWLIDYYMSAYETAKKNLLDTEKCAKWLAKYRTDRDNNVLFSHGGKTHDI